MSPDQDSTDGKILHTEDDILWLVVTVCLSHDTSFGNNGSCFLPS